jgi:hypothetical protein
MTPPRKATGRYSFPRALADTGITRRSFHDLILLHLSLCLQLLSEMRKLC